MKSKILLLSLVFLCSLNLVAQGLGNAKTTQSVQFPTSDTVGPGKARIYLLRTTGTLWNYNVTVYLDQKIIGSLGPKAYLLFEVDEEKPVVIGTTFIGNSTRNKNEENQQFLTINPKTGKTYYVEVKAKYGTFRGTTEMSPLEKDSAVKMIPTLDRPKVNYLE